MRKNPITNATPRSAPPPLAAAMMITVSEEAAAGLGDGEGRFAVGRDVTKLEIGERLGLDVGERRDTIGDFVGREVVGVCDGALDDKLGAGVEQTGLEPNAEESRQQNFPCDNPPEKHCPSCTPTNGCPLHKGFCQNNAPPPCPQPHL
jgi:hypothetical protein